MSETFSNIDEIIALVRKDIQGMFGSKELEESGRKVYSIMYKNVNNRFQMTGYDYDQTGNFRELFADEQKGFDPNRRNTSSMKVGFGDIGQGQGLNDPRFGMREEQRYVTFFRNKQMKANGSMYNTYAFLTLKAEKQMPKWIVLEFGTRSKADPLPKQFQISYTRRSERDFMLGPSVGKPYGNYKKKVFAMLSKKEFASMKDSHHADEVEKHYPDRPHPGTRPGRFFRKGLEDAKVPIYQEFGRGIENYLERINGR